MALWWTCSYAMPCVLSGQDGGTLLVQGGAPQIGYSRYRNEAARRCRDCGYVFFVPPPAEALADYYENEYATIAASWYAVDDDYATDKVTRGAQRVIDIAGKFGFGSSAIYHEIGCAFGGAVDELNRRNYPTTGTDLNTAAVAAGTARGNMAISSEDAAAFLRQTGRRPNVVYGYHVLEHMPDPAQSLIELKDYLAPDAIVILFVPNAMALYPAVYGYQKYIWFNFPAHLHLWSPSSGLCLARRAGYELLDVACKAWGLHPEATQRALSADDTPVAQRIRDHLIESGLAAEELVLVLTPEGSDTARKHEVDIAVTRRLCEINRKFEMELRALGATSWLGDPEPDPSPTREENEFSGEDYEALRQRAEAAEAALQAIQSSTSWRATALPRRLMNMLRRHDKSP